MNREELVQRIAEIQAAVDQSAANHHILVGRQAEAKMMLEMMDKVIAEKECEVIECEDHIDAV